MAGKIGEPVSNFPPLGVQPTSPIMLVGTLAHVSEQLESIKRAGDHVLVDSLLMSSDLFEALRDQPELKGVREKSTSSDAFVGVNLSRAPYLQAGHLVLIGRVST